MFKMEKLSLALVVFATIISFALALQLEGLPTKKPRLTKYTLKPSIAVSSTQLPATSSVYRINGTNGATCILIRTDALLSIQYRDIYKHDQEADVFLPDYPELSGVCDEDDSSISLTFKGFKMGIDFKKTPGGERWYVSNVDVVYSSSNAIFQHVDRPGLDVKLSTAVRNTLLFPTPVGKSYACPQEQIVTMYSPDENDKSGHLAKLYLRDLRMQSFMYKAANSWGPTFQCSATGTYRDEAAPLAVGLTLGACVLLTVAGYGLWRYFKVKNVQYGSMQ